MSDQHTPGPWFFDYGARSTVIRDTSSYYVAEMDVGAMDNGWEIGLADACLLASAPDMLEALRSASWLLADISPDGLVKKKVDAAIARATTPGFAVLPLAAEASDNKENGRG